MPIVLHFPTAARRRRRAVALPLFPAEVQPFPLTRCAGAVERFARHLRSLPTSQQRADAMVRHVEQEWDRLCGIGADERAIERAIIAFADAVWTQVARGFEHGGAA